MPAEPTANVHDPSIVGDRLIAERRSHALCILHSALMLAALMIGHHFLISAFCNARRASGVCCSRGSFPGQGRRARTHRRIGQGIDNRSIELGDDGYRRPLGRPKCLQQTYRTPGNPASSTVGISDAAATRALAMTA